MRPSRSYTALRVMPETVAISPALFMAWVRQHHPELEAEYRKRVAAPGPLVGRALTGLRATGWGAA